MSATIVVDLGFGDAGKGSLVDYLTRRGNVSAVVRFNGGAQAAHNVVTPSGTHHTFAQFGSGTLAGARTHLSEHMLIDPGSMLNEARHLSEIGCGDPFERLTVDENALVVTLYHKLLNRHRERQRGAECHGTCGMGIGEAVAMDLLHPELSIRARHLKQQDELAYKLYQQQDHVFAAMLGPEPNASFMPRHHDELRTAGERLRLVDASYLKTLARDGDLIFEGAQGVLLDEDFGFHPYTTWSSCTFKNAATLLSDIGYADPVTRIGVLRGYMTRHGPGPFPSENSYYAKYIQPDEHNRDDGWQGKFRIGNFDTVLARYAIEVCGGVDALALTNLDRLDHDPNLCQIVMRYRYNPGWRGDPEISYNNRSDPIQRITHIPPLAQPCVRAQSALTQFLFMCYPELGLGWPVDDKYGLIQLIESQLEVPVTITSYGPTANDKQVRK